MTLNARDPNLGKQILAARLRRRLSQGVVSRRSGIHPSYLSRIEHGKIRPTLETVQRIADALRTPLGELLALKPDKVKEGPCPISTTGQCLLDLLDMGPLPSPNQPTERYSQRQLRMLQQLALLLRKGDKQTLDAIGVLLHRLLGEDHVKKESQSLRTPGAATQVAPGARSSATSHPDAPRPPRTLVRPVPTS